MIVVILILAGAAAKAFYMIKTGRDIPIRWAGFVLITPLAFWYPAQTFRCCWRRLTFWLVLGTVITLHTLAFTTILREYPDWRLAWFIPTTMIEGMVVILILHAAFPEKRRHRNDG